MSNIPLESVKPEDKEALKKLMKTPSFASFIVYEVMSDQEVCPDTSLFTLEQVKKIGTAIARSTELVATSIVTGDWGIDREQESYYASQIKPWLRETGQDELRNYLYENDQSTS